MRQVGDITLDMEPLLLEMAEQGLQWGEILSLIHAYLMIHCPDSQEVYTADGSSPIFYYGPKKMLPSRLSPAQTRKLQSIMDREELNQQDPNDVLKGLLILLNK